ncbi:MAG: cobalt-precorrin-6A reductase, partial [Rhizobiaceae bacterium]
GGAAGLVAYLARSGTDLVVDATHPFAAEISGNAQQAAAASGTKLIAICRPGWQPVKGDRWRRHADVQSAISAIGEKRQNVFVTLGRQELAPLLKAPQHRYVVRSVDPVEPPLALPEVEYVLARGPFDVDAETALMSHHAINAVITKNSGGAASYAKLEAARRLGIKVEMIDRPEIAGDAVQTVDAALSMLDHWLVSEANLDV